MRDCLGIKAEVTELQLESIREEQLANNQPFLLKNIEPCDDLSHHDQIQKFCRNIIIFGNASNMLFSIRSIFRFWSDQE